MIEVRRIFRHVGREKLILKIAEAVGFRLICPNFCLCLSMVIWNLLIFFIWDFFLIAIIFYLCGMIGIFNLSIRIFQFLVKTICCGVNIGGSVFTVSLEIILLFRFRLIFIIIRIMGVCFGSFCFSKWRVFDVFFSKRGVLHLNDTYLIIFNLFAFINLWNGVYTITILFFSFTDIVHPFLSEQICFLIKIIIITNFCSALIYKFTIKSYFIYLSNYNFFT
jgi:hypothetical protein